MNLQKYIQHGLEVKQNANLTFFILFNEKKNTIVLYMLVHIVISIFHLFYY